MSNDTPPGQDPSQQQTLSVDQAIELALQHHNAGRLEEAKHIYFQIIQADPNQPVAMHLIGVVAYQMGENDIAIEFISKAIEIKPDYPEAHFNLGKSLKDAGRLEESVASYAKAIALKPDDADSHYNLGNVLKELERFDDAAASYVKAIEHNPTMAKAHNNMGLAFRALKKLDEAAECYHQAITLKPDYAEAYSNLGLVQQDQHQIDESMESYRKAISINPEYPEVHGNLGLAYQELGQLDEAISCYYKALSIKPDHAEALNNLGLVYQELGEFERAGEFYDKALRIAPEKAEVHNNIGMFQLLKGEFASGWEHYAWRWRMEDVSTRPRTYKEPSWDGGPLDDKKIFVYPEQGMGDVIQFARYLPLLDTDAKNVTLEVPLPLLRLFESSGFAENLVPTNQPPPAFDCQIPILNLPQLLNTTLETIPCGEPYLKTDPALVEKWAGRITTGGLRVGIVWAGNPDHKNDHNRSIDASLIMPLSEIPGVSLYSLQMGRDDDATKILRDKVTDLAASFKDFADTAAAMSNLDLIISVDTSVIHLAGALGRPVWTLLPFIPDWRWLLDRDDSPWYPTMRLFRQQDRGDWQGVIKRVCEALKERLNAH
jgi:tetratricopeptide (TPR) repeat protein